MNKKLLKMGQKNKFLVATALLTAVWAVLLWLVYEYAGGKLFYIAEGACAATFLFIVYFYRKIIKPIDTIAIGLNLLQEQDFSSRLAPIGQREVDRIVLLFNRMMAQLKDERLRVREQNHFLDLLINASPAAVIILDFEERISMLNPAAKAMVGCTGECIGKRLAEVGRPLMDEIAAIPQGGRRTVRLNGMQVYSVARLSFQDRGFPHPFVLVEQLTEEFHKAERNAYEKVIRMIAHEVNNTMGGITSILGTAKEMMPSIDSGTLCGESKEIADALQVCEERGLMLGRFITRFSDVVKIPSPQMQPYNLNDCVRYSARFMEKLCNERNISLRLQLTQEALPVSIDALLIEQVLVNIVKNSVESIGSGGEIVISTHPHPATLTVCDNGAGISDAVSKQLFTPFFTTKKSGQGIGLMFIREVLVAHGCEFTLSTGNDALTRFTMVFKK